MTLKKYITVTYASGKKERLRLGGYTLTFGGKEFKSLRKVTDNLQEARTLAEKWRRKGYNARINKGPGIRGARYTYGIYVRRAGK